MKKFFCLLLALMLCLMFVSCNNTTTGEESSESSNDKTDVNSTIVSQNSTGADITDTDTTGTDMPDDNNSDRNENGENVEETICCTNQCECCKNNINMVMLMVQTHFYHTIKAEREYNWYYVFKVLEEPTFFVEKLEDEYWYIMPEMYCDGEPVDYIPARLYVYMVEKSTGKIVNFLVF